MSTFKVIISGSRNIGGVDHGGAGLANLNKNERDDVIETIIEFVTKHNTDNLPIEIVSGTARGGDRFGELLAREKNWTLTKMPAKWEEFLEGDPCKVTKNGYKYNPIAGHRRNEKMGIYSDLLISLWDGKSSGTLHMRNFMEKLDKPILVLIEGKDFLKDINEAK